MTPSERRALWFLVAIAVLGVGVKAVRALRTSPPDVSVAALDTQIDRVDAAKRSRSGRGSRPSPKAKPPKSRESAAGSRTQPAPIGAAPPALPVPRARLDVDVATEAQLVGLPFVGPSIAKRIVDDRNRNGAFGCLTNLEPIYGIGPSLLKRLDTLVAFSGSSARAAACRR